MVDVGAKAVTERVAVAEGVVHLLPATLALIRSGTAPKGDVLAVTRIAGIMAAKKTSELIPLCHPLVLTSVKVDVTLHDPSPGPERGTAVITARVATSGQTGVEMEALTAVSVAALALYDMIKAVDRGASIDAVRLLEKRGGKSGEWHTEE
jgi:cyclic pyranopterin phosphate synthase